MIVILSQGRIELFVQFKSFFIHVQNYFDGQGIGLIIFDFLQAQLKLIGLRIIIPVMSTE